MTSNNQIKSPAALWSSSLGLLSRSCGPVAMIILVYAIVSGLLLYVFGAPRATNPLDVVAISPNTLVIIAILLFQYLLGWVAISLGFAHANDVHQGYGSDTLRKAAKNMPRLIFGAAVFIGAAALLAMLLRFLIDMVLVPALSTHWLAPMQMAQVVPVIEVVMLAVWVLVLIRIAFYIPRILVDNDDSWASVQEAAELTTGHVIRTFVVMLPSLLFYFGLSFVAMKYMPSTGSSTIVVAALVPVISLPWIIASMVVQYYDLVVRHGIRSEYYRKRIRELDARLHHS